MTFKTMAAEEKWRILSAQNFYATPNASDVNATEQLRNIKGTGQTKSGSILPPAYLMCGKVLLSVAYVCLFTGGSSSHHDSLHRELPPPPPSALAPSSYSDLPPTRAFNFYRTIQGLPLLRLCSNSFTMKRRLSARGRLLV